MCKNHLLIFSSFLDIWENVEWPRFFGPPGIPSIIQSQRLVYAGTVRYGVPALILEAVHAVPAVLVVKMAVRCAAYAVDFVKISEIYQTATHQCNGQVGM